VSRGEGRGEEQERGPGSGGRSQPVSARLGLGGPVPRRDLGGRAGGQARPGSPGWPRTGARGVVLARSGFRWGHYDARSGASCKASSARQPMRRRAFAIGLATPRSGGRSAPRASPAGSDDRPRRARIPSLGGRRCGAIGSIGALRMASSARSALVRYSVPPRRPHVPHFT